MGNNNQTFNKNTTALSAANKVDLTGRICIVTGSSSGIGIETVRVLALHGCTVYMACRTQSKAEQVRNEIAEDILRTNKDFDADAMLKILSLDLSSLESVHECAKVFLSLNEPLHYLINNAGIFGSAKYGESVDGYELAFATNHLGHFYLTSLLTPLLLQSQHSRVINVASIATMFYSDSYKATIEEGIQHKSGPFKNEYGTWSVYGFSKGCNILFAREMNLRYYSQGITSVSLHPGWINTSLSRNMKSYAQNLNAFGAKMFGKNVAQGAATTLRCVSLTDAEIEGGHYYNDCQENNDGLPANLQLQKSVKSIEKTVDEETKTDDTNIIENDESAGYSLWKWSELLITEKGFPLVVDANVDSNINNNSAIVEDNVIEEEEG